MRIYKIAKLNINGWILPNGEVVDIEEEHVSYLLKNCRKFGIEEGKYDYLINDPDINEEDKVLYEAFSNGGVRFYTLESGALSLESTKESIGKHVTTIHELYKRYKARGIVLDINDGYGCPKRWKNLRSVEELYSFAGNIKVYKISVNSPSYEYLGTCISTVDKSCIWDATEMAQLIENSESFDIYKIIPFINNTFKKKIEESISNFECGINDNIVWVYDINKDIHYFYRKTK